MIGSLDKTFSWPKPCYLNYTAVTFAYYMPVSQWGWGGCKKNSVSCKLPTRPNMSTEFNYWGYTKAGLTQDLLLAILHKPAANSHYELETFPTYGILIELLEFATNLGSKIHGLSMSRILKICIDTLYPASTITCPNWLECAIRIIALPIENKTTSMAILTGNGNQKFKVRISDTTVVIYRSHGIGIGTGVQGGQAPSPNFTLETLLIFMLKRRSPRSRCILRSATQNATSYAYAWYIQ